MARLDKAIIGPIRGRLGPLVASSWKGEPYLKTRPGKRGKKRGVREKLNQNRFAAAHYWLHPVIDFLRVGFKGYTPRLEGYNAAKSYCLKHAFTGDGLEKNIDPALIRVSYGDLPLPSHVSMERSGDYVLRFTWDKSYVSGTNKWDQAMLLAYDHENKQPVMKLTGQFRAAGADELLLPEKKQMNYHVYIAFTAHDRSRQSHSVYLGAITT